MPRREENKYGLFAGQVNTNDELEIDDELEIKEEPISDGEDEMILPDISDLTDVDPLQVDKIKQEIPQEQPQEVSINVHT